MPPLYKLSIKIPEDYVVGIPCTPSPISIKQITLLKDARLWLKFELPEIGEYASCFLNVGLSVGAFITTKVLKIDESTSRSKLYLALKLDRLQISHCTKPIILFYSQLHPIEILTVLTIIAQNNQFNDR